MNRPTGDSKNISIVCWVRWNILHILFHRKCYKHTNANEHGASLYLSAFVFREPGFSLPNSQYMQIWYYNDSGKNSFFSLWFWKYYSLLQNTSILSLLFNFAQIAKVLSIVFPPAHRLWLLSVPRFPGGASPSPVGFHSCSVFSSQPDLLLGFCRKHVGCSQSWTHVEDQESCTCPESDVRPWSLQILMKSNIQTEKSGAQWIFTSWAHLCSQHPDQEMEHLNITGIPEPPSPRFHQVIPPFSHGHSLSWLLDLNFA